MIVAGGPAAYVGSFDRICHELSTTDPEETGMILTQFARIRGSNTPI
jgi:hypothetical protein